MVECCEESQRVIAERFMKYQRRSDAQAALFALEYPGTGDKVRPVGRGPGERSSARNSQVGNGSRGDNDATGDRARCARTWPCGGIRSPANGGTFRFAFQ